MQWRDLRQQASSQLGLYLPVLVMAVLALGSWWLLRNAPGTEPARTPTVARHEPDYFMRDFAIQEYSAQGELRNELRGHELLHYPDTDSFTLEAPLYVGFDTQGRRLEASGKRGTSNHDGSLIELFENAQVRRTTPGDREPPLQFRGDHLRVFGQDKRVESDQAVVLQRGTSTFRGGNLRYDHRSGQAQLGAPVTAHLPPAGARP